MLVGHFGKLQLQPTGRGVLHQAVAGGEILGRFAFTDGDLDLLHEKIPGVDDWLGQT